MTSWGYRAIVRCRHRRCPWG